MKHLNSLGNYKYNWSEGDSYQLELENWTDANVLLESIRRKGNQLFSEDIYARLMWDDLRLFKKSVSGG